MAHSIEYNSDGTRARVFLDIDGASLDADANPIGSQWQTLTNVLTDIPGVLPKRGAIVNAGSNSTDINDASGKLAFHDGVKVSGATYRPYVGVCLDGSTVESYVQVAGSSRVLIDNTSGRGLPVSKCPTVGGFLVLGGRDAGNSTYPNRAGSATLYGGASDAVFDNSGTVTATSGSATITGASTSFASTYEGCLFQVTTDTYKNAFYRIKKVVNSTTLILDRNYGGDATGAGLSYVIVQAQTFVQPVAGPWGTTNSIPRFKVAAGWWGRLVCASTREAGSSGTIGDNTPEYPSRIRWSGTIDSDEGTGSATGIYAFDANGCIDLADRFGEVLALAQTGDARLVFQESGLTVLRGAPVYDGTGSLDASEVHPGVAINGGFAYEQTPQGVFFFDKNVGPCVYDGSRVQRLGDKRVTRTMLPYGITAVGYYDGKVLFSGTTTAGIFVFDTSTGQWSFQVPPAIVASLIPGRVENDEDVVGLGAGVQVVNLANMFDNPGVAATDWDGTAFTVDLKTGKIGSTFQHLRPETAYVTYRLTDLSTTNPYVTATVTTGLPDSSDSAHTAASASTELVETTDVETELLTLSLDRDPMVQVRLQQTNGAGKFELYALVLDCAAEGDGVSS